ncbi:hypothetical protein [Desulforapulum autotrophicum]|nr:hypothetical protein [Desulforapulum autotrophicum]
METRLEQLIQDELPKIKVETICSIECVSQNLRRPLNGISVIVLFIVSQSQIENFLILKPFFDNTRLILVLPDNNKGLVAKGLQLNPCFVTYLDNDPHDITSVLRKIEQLKTGKQPLSEVENESRHNLMKQTRLATKR